MTFRDPRQTPDIADKPPTNPRHVGIGGTPDIPDNTLWVVGDGGGSGAAVWRSLVAEGANCFKTSWRHIRSVKLLALHKISADGSQLKLIRGTPASPFHKLVKPTPNCWWMAKGSIRELASQPSGAPTSCRRRLAFPFNGGTPRIPEEAARQRPIPVPDGRSHPPEPRSRWRPVFVARPVTASRPSHCWGIPQYTTALMLHQHLTFHPRMCILLSVGRVGTSCGMQRQAARSR